MRKYTLIFLALSLLILASCGKEAEKLPGGVKMEYITKGSGETLKPDNYVFFNYEEYRNDTLLRDSKSAGVPFIAPVKSKEDLDKNPGYQPILYIFSKLKVGDSVKVSIPVDSIPQAPFKGGTIEAFLGITDVKDSLAFDAYLAEEKAKRQTVYDAVVDKSSEIIDKYYKGTLEVEKVGDLKFYFEEKGDGVKAEAGDLVQAQYHGVLGKFKGKSETAKVGDVFDSSFAPERGQPFKFPLGQGRVIKGWDEGFQNLSKGAKAYMFIPSEMAYGANGGGAKIPPNSELMFYVEVEGVDKAN